MNAPHWLLSLSHSLNSTENAVFIFMNAPHWPLSLCLSLSLSLNSTENAVFIFMNAPHWLLSLSPSLCELNRKHRVYFYEAPLWLLSLSPSLCELNRKRRVYFYEAPLWLLSLSLSLSLSELNGKRRVYFYERSSLAPPSPPHPTPPPPSLSVSGLCVWRMCVYLCAFLPKIRTAAVKRRIHRDNAGLHGIIARIWRGSLETAVYEGPKDKLRNRWTGKRVIRTCILPRQLRIPDLQAAGDGRHFVKVGLRCLLNEGGDGGVRERERGGGEDR